MPDRAAGEEAAPTSAFGQGWRAIPSGDLTRRDPRSIISEP